MLKCNLSDAEKIELYNALLSTGDFFAPYCGNKGAIDNEVQTLKGKAPIPNNDGDSNSFTVFFDDDNDENCPHISYPPASIIESIDYLAGYFGVGSHTIEGSKYFTRTHVWANDTVEIDKDNDKEKEIVTYLTGKSVPVIHIISDPDEPKKVELNNGPEYLYEVTNKDGRKGSPHFGIANVRRSDADIMKAKIHNHNLNPGQKPWRENKYDIMSLYSIEGEHSTEVKPMLRSDAKRLQQTTDNVLCLYDKSTQRILPYNHSPFMAALDSSLFTMFGAGTGEKEVDNAKDLANIFLLFNIGGEGATYNMIKREARGIVKKRNDIYFIIFCDNDETGLSLKRYAGTYNRMIDAGLPPENVIAVTFDSFKDLTEWFEAGGTGNELNAKLKTIFNSIAENPALNIDKDKTKENAPSVKINIEKYGPHDNGNAKYFLDVTKNHYAYCSQEMKWYVYNDKVWVSSLAKSKLSTELASTLEDRYNALVSVYDDLDPKEDKFMCTKYKLSLNASLPNEQKINNAVKILSDKLSFNISEFSSAKHVLGVNNGILNLKTKELTPHSHDGPKFRSISAYNYNPQAECPKFMEALRSSLIPQSPDYENYTEKNYEDLIPYVQMVLGYALTGETKRAAFCLSGDTSAGKSTIMKVVSGVLNNNNEIGGDIVKGFVETRIGNSFIEGKENKFQMAELLGTRVLWVDELDFESIMYSDSFYKGPLTDGTPISAEVKFGPSFMIIPTLKTFMTTNHPIRFAPDASACWDRTRYIVFPNSFANGNGLNQGDDLSNIILEGEGEGVLNYFVDGAYTWYQGWDDDAILRLREPKIFSDYANKLRYDDDGLQKFLDSDYFKVDKYNTDYKIPSKFFIEAYNNWCQENFEPNLFMTRTGRFIKKEFINTMGSKKFTIKERDRVNGKQQRQVILGIQPNDNFYYLSPKYGLEVAENNKGSGKLKDKAKYATAAENARKSKK